MEATQLEHPDMETLELAKVLHALSDPQRLGIVRALAEDSSPRRCGSFDYLGVAKSTLTHHFRVLREAGVIRQERKGTSKFMTLRREDLDARFPELLGAVLDADRTPPSGRLAAAGGRDPSPNLEFARVKLSELIAGAEADAVEGGDPEIAGLAYDSRAVGPGYLFFCITGLEADGHEFAADAIEAGAVALIVERRLALDVPQALVTNARVAMAPLAVRFFGDPTAELAVAGVTGTNGKTTTAFLLRKVIEASGRRCGLLGTVKQVVGGAEEEVERTTPEAIDLQATFRRMREAGDEACSMEVSSHALVLHRADAIHFDAKIFTNLTQDHLDFHADMEDYFAAKRLLFEVEDGTAVVNVDDPYGRKLADDFDCRTYSASGIEADYRAEGITYDTSSAQFRALTPAGEVEVRTSLPGHFNVSNALAAIAGAHVLGIEPAEAARALAEAGRVPGRFEPIDEGQPFTVLVDYAHTPDSLDNVLRARGG